MESAGRRVLFVDDDALLLAGLKRQHRGHFELVTLEDPRQALEKLDAGETFAVVVADLRMPGMDGLQLLTQVEQRAPDATRILLTGNADLITAQRAVNEGHVFRFLTKPCETDELRASLRAAIEFYDLKVAQRELLERTLRGAVQVLADVLGLVNPAAFGRASRVTRYVKAIVERLDLPDAWRYEIAAMLSQVGCVTVPPAVVEKLNSGQELDLTDRRILSDHPRLGQKLLAGIPRLEEVAEMICYQDARYRSPGSAGSSETPVGKDLPMGSRILKIALDLDELERRHGSRSGALEKLLARRDRYDPQIVDVLEDALGTGVEDLAEIDVSRLTVDMIIAEDVRTANGLLLVSAGQHVNVGMIERLQNWARRGDRSLAQTLRIIRAPPSAS
jgi:response regulator RpfG family c-di-GMP phosphodiesterase